MKEDEVLTGLEGLMADLGVAVRYEKGDFDGGVCKLKDKRLCIVNSTMSPAQRIKVLAAELSQMDLENVFMMPAIRQVIDEVGKEKG
jgi:hypothetical protein